MRCPVSPANQISKINQNPSTSLKSALSGGQLAKLNREHNLAITQDQLQMVRAELRGRDIGRYVENRISDIAYLSDKGMRVAAENPLAEAQIVQLFRTYSHTIENEMKDL